MMARAEVNGLLVNVDAGKVSVTAPVDSGSPVLTLTYGVDLQEFQAELDSCWQLSSVTSTSWDLAQASYRAANCTTGKTDWSGDLDSKTLAAVLNAGDFGLQTAAPLESDALTAWSKAQQTKAALSRIRGRMQFQGSALVKPGVILELKSVGKHFNGNVIASNVVHYLIDGNWVTEVEFGMPAYWFTEEHQIQAPEAAAWTAGIGGLHIGIVLKLDADPDGQYKIQVSIPIMNASSGGVWARLSSFYGSSALVLSSLRKSETKSFWDSLIMIRPALSFSVACTAANMYLHMSLLQKIILKRSSHVAS
jgi:hypothetical protein